MTGDAADDDGKAHRITPAQLLALTAQLALVLAAISASRIGESFGLALLLPLIGLGFVVHALVPARLRPAVFVVLSLAAIARVLGVEAGAALVAAGLGLIGIVHLPVRPVLRVILLLTAGGVLAWLRASDDAGTVWELALPVLGSMFMFRLIIYAYDNARPGRSVDPWQRLAYFFMLPNVCFLLFPVVDYKTFVRSWYAADAYATYRRGLALMSRGIVHIVLYRAVYHYLVPDPVEVTGLGQLAWFMATTYGLYLRISGQFHIVVGVMCLFGYSLPDTHHLYFMATNFNDLWRRINVYWRDFMAKIFYYPVWFRLRKRGPRLATLAATAAVFMATWLLHSYQWFWLRGSFPMGWVDLVFWTIFAAIVGLGALREARRGGTPRAAPTRLARATSGVATFAGMCVLWSFISSPTISDWVHLVAVARYATATDVLGILGAAALLVAVFAAIDMREASRDPARAAALAPGMLACGLVVLLSTGVGQGALGADGVGVVEALRQDRLNERDQRMLERGYYENVLDMDRYLAQLWKRQLQEPAGWNSRGQVVVTDPDDGFYWYLRPNLDMQFKRAHLTTNSLGMRDQMYARTKGAGVWRAVLVGGSGSMGSGVPDGANYESIVERQLNQSQSGAAEILNFSVPGYDLLRRLMMLENRALAYEPDIILIETVGGRDGRKVIEHLVQAVVRRAVVPFAPAAEVIRASGAHAALPESEIYRRLLPYEDTLVEAVYRRFAELARSAGAVAVWLHVPLPGDGNRAADVTRRHRAMAESLGLVPIGLVAAFDDVATADLRLAPWDGHPNAFAHRLLADELMRALMRKRLRLRL